MQDIGPIQRTIDPLTRQAAVAFLARLQAKYAPLRAFVYGGRARGTDRPDSDADIAVVLAGRQGDRALVGMDMASIAYDVLKETGVQIQPLPVWETELDRPELFGNPALIESIKRDGVPV